MRIRKVVMRIAVPLVAVTLVATGCGSGADGPTSAGELTGKSDINSHDVSELRDGGELRFALTAMPENWNGLHNDSDGESGRMQFSTMPRAFKSDPGGKLTVNTDYFTDAKVTNTSPQQVTYTINPKAVWSDGSPITWEDISSQAAALSGRDKAFVVGANNGFDRVEKVEKGVDDRQAIMTFNKNFAAWDGQFAGNNMLYPKSVTANPEAFNKSLIDGPKLSAGPFMVKSIDKTQKIITLGRNPMWWGATPKLDTIKYRVLDDSATMPALRNNEIDAIGIGDKDDLKQAQDTRGIAIRRAPGNSWSHMTFNGAPGSLLADPKLRVALSKAVDRQAIVTSTQQGLVTNPRPLNNHIYIAGQDGYQDNSAPDATFNLDQAAKELDELGWKRVGDVREKDGKKLEIRNVMYQSDSWTQMATLVQQDFAKIGVKLIIESKPGQGLFKDVLTPGNFDIGNFAWLGDVSALMNLNQIYAYNPDDLQGNYGRIGSPELNVFIDQVMSELDPKKAIELANELDKKLWANGFSLPLAQSAGIVAVNDKIANYGAAGLMTLDYTKIGFLK